MELVKGQIVQSRRGRDVTGWYAVCGFEKDRVLVSNGKKWPLATPKKKNPLHLQATNTVLPADTIVDDLKLRAALEQFAESRLKQGG